MGPTLENRMIKFFRYFASPVVQRFRRNRNLRSFYRELKRFKSLNTSPRLPVAGELRPYLDDRTSATSFDAHYIYHPAWAARVVKSINPNKHIDISSTLSFCTMLSAFIDTEFYDYRPAMLSLDDLTCS